jgi:hypothetical protein
MFLQEAPATPAHPPLTMFVTDRNAFEPRVLEVSVFGRHLQSAPPTMSPENHQTVMAARLRGTTANPFGNMRKHHTPPSISLRRVTSTDQADRKFAVETWFGRGAAEFRCEFLVTPFDWRVFSKPSQRTASTACRIAARAIPRKNDASSGLMAGPGLRCSAQCRSHFRTSLDGGTNNLAKEHASSESSSRK